MKMSKTQTIVSGLIFGFWCLLYSGCEPDRIQFPEVQKLTEEGAEKTTDPGDSVCGYDCILNLSGQEKEIKIGFSIGFLSNLYYAFVPEYMEQEGVENDVLKTISDDGFGDLRIMSLFNKHQNPNTSDMKDDYTVNTIPLLQKISERGFKMILSLSNYPFQFLPDQSVIDQNEYAKKKLSYSNEYPPNDRDLYKEYLRSFLIDLREALGETVFNNLRFEIENEPDAASYFGGTPRDYLNIVDDTAEVIKGINPDLEIGIAGFTGTLGVPRSDPDHEARRQKYYPLAQQYLKSSLGDFYSYHIYNNKFKLLEDGSPDVELMRELSQFDNPFIKKRKNILTEWHLSTRASSETEAIYDSKDYMNYLIDIVVASYEAEIAEIYLHTLMDHPKKVNHDPEPPTKPTYSNTLFDVKGRAKGGYAYLKLMKDVVHNGFIVEKTKNLKIIKGKQSIILKSKKKDLAYDLSKFSIIASSDDVIAGSGIFPHGAWIVADISE